MNEVDQILKVLQNWLRLAYPTPEYNAVPYFALQSDRDLAVCGLIETHEALGIE